MPDPHVAIAMPAYGNIYPEVALSLANLYHTTANKIQTTLDMTNICYIDYSRNRLVEGALDIGATHIMWLDSDITCSPTMVMDLLAHDEPVASGLYHHKDINEYKHAPVAFNFLPEGGRRFIDLDLEKPQYVDGVGHGCVLINTDLYRKLDPPWYQSLVGSQVGEDVFFCARFHENGTRVLLDPAVRCGHMYRREITTEHWQMLNA